VLKNTIRNYYPLDHIFSQSYLLLNSGCRVNYKAVFIVQMYEYDV